MKSILIVCSAIFIWFGSMAKTCIDKNKSKVTTPGKIVQAQQPIPFPLSTGFSNDYLRATFWKCHYSSAGKQHAYWVILPNTMRPTEIKPKVLPQVGLTSMGVYNTIDKTLPYIEVWVWYETVNKKQSPAQWMLGKLKLTGERVLNQNIITYPDGQKNLDVLTAKTLKNGVRVISRFTGISKGNTYYLLKAAASEKEYLSQAKNMFHTVSHWGLE